LGKSIGRFVAEGRKMVKEGKFIRLDEEIRGFLFVAARSGEVAALA
jgi:hypothetical protein